MESNDKYDVYICSSLRNGVLNTDLRQFFEKQKIVVYDPGRDTPQNSNPESIFKANCKAITGSRVIVAVLDYFGKDFGFEIGFSHAQGKTLVGFLSGKSDSDSVMVLQAIPLIKTSFEDLLRFINRTLKMT